MLGTLVAPSPAEFPVFQAGPRVCLGMDMAIFEAKLAACALLQRYNFELKLPYGSIHILVSGNGIIGAGSKCFVFVCATLASQSFSDPQPNKYHNASLY